MRTKTHIKADALTTNHNQTLVRAAGADARAQGWCEQDGVLGGCARNFRSCVHVTL